MLDLSFTDKVPARLKAGTTSERWHYVVKHNRAPVDLTGATVELTIQNKLDQTGFVRSVTLDADTDGGTFYDPVEDDVAQPGTFLLEYRVTLLSGKVLVSPEVGYVELIIEPNLDVDTPVLASEKFRIRNGLPQFLFPDDTWWTFTPAIVDGERTQGWEPA